jgi:hypothetical protein
MMLYAGRYTVAAETLDELERRTTALSTTDPRVEAALNKAKASWALYKGSSEAPSLLAAAVAGFEQAGDLRNACNARQDLGFVFTDLGAYEDAERLLLVNLWPMPNEWGF